MLFFVCGGCGLAELIIFMVRKRKMKGRRDRILKTLYKMMENRVLSKTLCRNISRDQAAEEEFQSAFLCLEFPDTKPWLANIFSLDEAITIGRSRDNMVSIRDSRISRLHCKIAVVNGGLYLQDLGSANGTKIRHGFFHRKILSHHDTEKLQDGDVIVLGNYRMKIRIYYGSEAVGIAEFG